jgi:hypothetical protein
MHSASPAGDASVLALASAMLAAGAIVVTDHISYNAGSEVRIRLQPRANGRASIRYAGDPAPVQKNVAVSGSGYVHLWNIPWEARTGRYEVDFMPVGGGPIQYATSFVVHRQLAKIIAVDLDKTFYTSGDSVNPRIVIRNVSNRKLQNLQVEFEPYTYPWIAPAPDEPPIWKKILSQSLSLSPGEQREFAVENAATIQAGKEPAVIYYSVVIRDSRDPDHIYDLAFAPAAFAKPPNTWLPKQYPFLYLYGHLRDVPRSETYRRFYPPRFVSGAIEFDTSHTMFPIDASPSIAFSVNGPATNLWARVLTSDGKEIQKQRLAGKHILNLKPLAAGIYTAVVSMETAAGAVVARNQIEFSVNPLPKSILVFCAHEDDDTAHPGLDPRGGRE